MAMMIPQTVSGSSAAAARKMAFHWMASGPGEFFPQPRRKRVVPVKDLRVLPKPLPLGGQQRHGGIQLSLRDSSIDAGLYKLPLADSRPWIEYLHILSAV
jgi:hypothetical protein